MPFLKKLRRRGFLPWCRRDASLSGAPRAGGIVLEALPGPRRGRAAGRGPRAAAFGTHPGSRHATTGMGNTRFDRYCQGPAPLGKCPRVRRDCQWPLLGGPGPGSEGASATEATGRQGTCQWPSARLRAGQRSGTQTKRICRGAIRAGRHCHATCNGDLDVRTGGVEAIDYCPPNIMLAPVFGPQVDKSYGAGYSSSLLPSTSANGASHSKSCAEASCQL